MPNQITPARLRPRQNLLFRLKVLIIEDEQIVALDLDDQVQNMGALFTLICSSVAEAKKQLQAQRYDLAIVDIKLSDGCGLSLLPTLARMAIPVVITSGYPPMDIDNIPFVPKPYSSEILAEAFRLCLLRHSVKQTHAQLEHSFGMRA